MRILYIDIDTLRADHLSCYGYHRNTSPHIDSVANEGIRFDRCYASDTPCLPSRMALLTGRFGIHNGVVSHGGAGAEPFAEGAGRGFFSSIGKTSFPERLRRAGYTTATLSSFAQRHSAFHWHAGFQQSDNVGKRGLENADEVHALARDWLARHGQRDRWFLHVHFWDPHTPYRVPEDYGNPFANDPTPAWLTESVRAAHWKGYGPHSAQEAVGFSADYPWGEYPRQPRQIDSMQAARRMFDGYDTGVRYADDYVGRILEQLQELGVADETAVLISADHGETLGELNIYGDHHTADEHTSRVPMIVKWPGLARGHVDRGLHYQIDVMATVCELAGAELPANWDAQSFADELGDGRQTGRDYLVLSQGAWTCQRSVRFGDYLCVRTYHDGYHDFRDVMLFDLKEDPHEQCDLASRRPDIVRDALFKLERWVAEMMRTSTSGIDPLWTVLHEGGPFHVRGQLDSYTRRLRQTGRESCADRLERLHAPPPT